MEVRSIPVSFVRMDSSDGLKEYVYEKLNKPATSKLLEGMTSAEITFSNSMFNKGVKDDFHIDIMVDMPNSRIRVEEDGPDMYALIDSATDKLDRRLKRYHGKREQWEGKVPWRVMEAQEAMKAMESEIGPEDDISTAAYAEYVPHISSRTQLSDMTPRDEAEAIELMELSGNDQFLFKNRSTGKISMVYRRPDGSYAMVEPGDGVE